MMVSRMTLEYDASEQVHRITLESHVGGKRVLLLDLDEELDDTAVSQILDRFDDLWEEIGE